MLTTTLRIDGQAFLLSDTIDIDQLRQEFVTAVQSGAAFVDFDTCSGGRVSVLTTPRIAVRFESMEIADDGSDDGVEITPTFDLETYTIV